jgi:prepilin-type N-terminal cleavage/methylation domain-containing protein
MRSRTASSLRITSGLTLIEVVVTVSIIGLVAAVALPAMLDLSLGVDAGSLEPVRSILLQARRDATNGVTVEVTMVPTSGRYRVVTRRPGEDASVREGVVPLSGARGRRPDDRFRVVFRPVGIGVGDTLVAEGVRLRVTAATDEVIIER